jgi:hypothetical protein
MKAAQAGSIRSALKVASSTALAADALRKTAAATVYRASKPRVSLAARPEKREYLRQFGSHPGNPG